jgi:hypothetical protein
VNTAISQIGAAKIAAISADFASGEPMADADLAMIVERWPMLPDDVRRAMVAMIEVGPTGGSPE